MYAMKLVYARIQKQLTDALPEIRPAAETYWRVEGAPGEDSGAYIFVESLFASFLQILLAMESSPGRDRLLRRAFDFVDEMMTSDDGDVATLAQIGIFHGRAEWWWVRASPFLGVRTKTRLDQTEPDWRLYAPSTEYPTQQEKREINDLFGVRAVIASELAPEGVRPADVPGVTYTPS